MRRQRGVALITAVLIVALAVILTTSLFLSQEVRVRRTANLLHHDQALHYALGAESWARRILARDAEGGGSVDHLGEVWATQLPPTLIEHGQMQGRIEDLQARLNLNGPPGDRDPLSGYNTLVRGVLAQAGLDPNTLGAIRDWSDPDNEVDLQGGAEDWDYLGQSPAYRVPNAPFLGVEELALVRGIEEAGFQAIAPLLCALPEATPINVNTMAPELLPLIFPELSEADVERIVAERVAKPFDRLDAFFEYVTGPADSAAAAPPAATGAKPEVLAAKRPPLSVGSSYFLLTTVVTLGDARLQLRSMLHRKEGRVEVVRRWFEGE